MPAARLLLCVLFLFVPCAASAQVANFLYERSVIPIIRAHPPQPLPWSSEPPPSPSVSFDVEVRDAGNLYGPKREARGGWYNLSTPEENKAVMLLFKSPDIYPVSKTTEYVPLDILMIDANGYISQMWRGVVLSQLEGDIVPEKPVRAIMFLKGGVTAQLSIGPGDLVDSPVFRKQVLVINPDASRVMPKKAEDAGHMLIAPPLPQMPALPPQTKQAQPVAAPAR